VRAGFVHWRDMVGGTSVRTVYLFRVKTTAEQDHLNDFGMTSPTAISKSFTHYGDAHPELWLTC
jgi:hypothetical protein